MFCEHPTCSLESNTICKYHCHLSVCEQHRIEHEKKLLHDFEHELNHLNHPITNLLNQTRSKFKDLEQTRQQDLDRINSIYDSHLSIIDQRMKFIQTTNTFISNKREQLINFQNGDYRLTRNDYQVIEHLTEQMQKNLREQYQFNHHIRDRNKSLKIYSIDKQVECIEILDSEDEKSESSMDLNNTEQELSSPEKKKMKIDNTKRLDVNYVHDFCPLTQLGVFGLKRSHNLERLCSESDNRRRYLYFHLTIYHRLKSSFATKITKAVGTGQDPRTTTIFPPDSPDITVESIPCPFDSKASKFNEKNAIPNTPCTTTIYPHYFKAHLCKVHSISPTNAKLIYRAVKKTGTMSHVQFEEDLCQRKKIC